MPAPLESNLRLSFSKGWFQKITSYLPIKSRITQLRGQGSSQISFGLRFRNDQLTRVCGLPASNLDFCSSKKLFICKTEAKQALKIFHQLDSVVPRSATSLRSLHEFLGNEGLRDSLVWFNCKVKRNSFSNWNFDSRQPLDFDTSNWPSKRL